MGNPQKKIVVAFVFGVLLVCGAYFLSQKNASAQKESADAEKVERAYIKPVDTDQNGVPDWQDTLLVDDTITIDEATSTYEKPTTLTGRFGISFFEKMLRSKMYGAFGDSPEELASSSVERLKSEAVDELFSEKDIQIFETSDATLLKSYGNTVATILTSSKSAGDNELSIMEDYLRYNDQETLAQLEPIATAYTSMIKNLLEVEVPSTYQREHLDLLNALSAIREDIRGMQKIETDALYSLLRTKRYEDDVLGMSNSIKNLFNKLYLQDGIRFAPDEPVLRLMVFPQTP